MIKDDFPKMLEAVRPYLSRDDQLEGGVSIPNGWVPLTAEHSTESFTSADGVDPIPTRAALTADDKKLTSYGENKSHSRQIGHKEAGDIGLNVERLEEDDALQDAVLSVHHLFVHTFNNTPAYKIIASTNGNEFIQSAR